MNEDMKILVVDDEADSRHVTATILKKRGYSVSSATNGVEALDYISSHEINIVICDIEMPEMNGFELLSKIKSQYRDIVVAVMTGYGDTYSVREALIKGADEYIGKPFTAQELNLIIERLCWHVTSGKKAVADMESNQEMKPKPFIK